MSARRSPGRVVIIGAGIVGAACARFLALDGWRIVVVDAHAVGSGSTAAGMGHVVVMDDSEAQFQLCRRSHELWESLEPQLPASVEYDHAGTIWVAVDDDEMAEVERKRKFYEDRNYAVEVLDPAGLRAWEPNLRDGLVGGLRVPGDRVLYPPVAAAWLLRDQPGVDVRIGPSVVEVADRGVRLADDSWIEADFVVLAAGAEAVRLVPELPIRPRKGHLVITDRYPGFVRHQLIELGYLKSAHGAGNESVAFNVQPRPTGQLLIGSSRQFGSEDPAVEPFMVERMLQRAFEYMPVLARLSAVRAWTGFRAATPDSLPIIGALSDRPWLFVAAGHEGLGITTSLATAELVSDQLAHRPTSINADPYRPNRSFLKAHHG